MWPSILCTEYITVFSTVEWKEIWNCKKSLHCAKFSNWNSCTEVRPVSNSTSFIFAFLCSSNAAAMAGWAVWSARSRRYLSSRWRLLQEPELRSGVSGHRRLCVAEIGLKPRRDKFGGVSLNLAQLRSPESLDQGAFGRWLQGKCLSLEACGETEDRQSDQRRMRSVRSHLF